MLSRKPFIVPIPGTRKHERVRENVGASTVVLTTDDLAEIEAAIVRIEIHGARLPEELLELTNR
ncbi:hypothetical protein [Rhizobium leguminosarum]|uniref:hypothetical protein n=1 Tax=Rhizobium leguminosarum TaxID=384 RepID=UPI003F9A0A9F